MERFRNWYWAIIALFSGTVAAGCAVHMGAEPMEMMHSISTTVEYAGEAGTLHTDNGLMVASGGAIAGVKETVEELKSNLERILGEDGLESDISDAKDAAHDAKKKVEEISERNAELVDELKSVKEDRDALQEQADELETKLKEGFAPNSRQQKNIGRKVVQNVEEKGYDRNSDQSKLTTQFEGVGVKDITNVAGSGGDVVYPMEREDIIGKPQLRTPTVLDLLTILETEKDAVEYIEQSSETDNASPQSGQGSTLSQTDMEFDRQTVTIETVGHIAKASVQILDDAPRLRTFVNTRMRQLLELELEDQVLTGDGQGNNLEGIIPNATNYDANLETVVDGTTTDLDRIGVMMLQVQRNNFPPTGIMLSPLNWWGIVLQKDDDGEYQFANPQSSTSPRLWGIPVVSTNAMPEGEAVVGNFEVGVTFYDRMQTALKLSTENRSDFEDLMVTIRAYLRGGNVVDQPLSVVHNANMDATAPNVGS